MLEVVQLECRRGDRLLFSALDVEVGGGTLLHVRGRNGSGKTTLLRALCGLFTPERGKIRWRGTPIAELGDEYHRDLLYFGHLNGIKGDLTGVENLRVTTTLDGERLDEQALWAALARIGLQGFEDLPTRMLSQGQKKRVALARLVLSRAPLWVLDEPFTALDTAAVALLETLIAEHVAGGGIVVLTTHQDVPLTSGQVARLDLGS
ncbi:MULTISPECIES: cytochrome c biogenesis heme-transporting ATPase CcmA [Marichromatium]|uniref:Heme exporter protein A n=1 Tax=Marichromatium gracile TaxID=1048 RepID=A0A4R4A630_MARGR|nr:MULTISPECIES: cytochrome c biogenesis heme-transporting ATPase CcmA [Marichromatium]MBO8086918.1 cytochrome c biogenesis heme-transporting ATPase CcmA [Marichromatium sp.]MBK1708391.1 heme ABC exporter ATP-binding protein CcmA [Marichromatium gracile]RNE89794.1 cytochrome c biogenesis heme-transporting ATPase CcmA [Marichromatium sp. AB31]RNE94254.1 cytochrome c biogenesis heme-transporting ATPase CcmA [Marichromatium sp. AB32]TCW34233.1 heme exporter protein A [Marichromatium gracile]